MINHTKLNVNSIKKILAMDCPNTSNNFKVLCNFSLTKMIHRPEAVLTNGKVSRQAELHRWLPLAESGPERLRLGQQGQQLGPGEHLQPLRSSQPLRHHLLRTLCCSLQAPLLQCLARIQWLQVRIREYAQLTVHDLQLALNVW